MSKMSNLSIEEQNLIKEASASGIVFIGKDDEDMLEFIGTDHDWRKFNNLKV